jgi:dipeptidyl aminopeptidase/acylaminoacyl peptidase
MHFRRVGTLALVCASLLLPARGNTQDGRFTPQHVAKLRVVTEAVIAPDGSQVAYVLAVPRDLAKEKDGGSWTELHVVDTKGNSRPFITGQVNVANIGWTPDSKSITFLAKRATDATLALHVIGAAGGEARKIREFATDIQSYSLSGDAKSLAFLATEPPSKANKAKLDQGFNQEIYEEDQPPVRVWIAGFADPSRPAQMLDVNGSASELQYNPKQDMLAVALAPSPSIDDHLMFRKVHLVEFTNRDAERLKVVKAANLHNPGKLGQLAWSPDGTKLAMITGADPHDPREGRLWVAATANGAWTDLSSVLKSHNKAHADAVAWDSDLSVIESHGVATQLAVYTIGTDEGGKCVFKGSATHTIPKGLVLSNLSRSERRFNAAACIGQSAVHPPEVYILDGNPEHGDGTPRRLTDSNPWLKTLAFAKQEIVKYKARDGLDLEGVLIRPLHEEPGKRYPLVLTVHGGPEAHYANGWVTLYHSLGQVAAARGMVVFYPNYRGSTGYGVDFSMKGQRDAGGKEFEDLIDGVDHLVRIGLVDAKKVGITGGSYGGYATAFGSTYYSDRFAAGVMFVGISNWISCAGTSDIPQEMFLVHHRKWLWDDWDYFGKASPLKYLDRAKTPLLILHGKNDPRVNPGQSLELYRHLKVRNQAPVRLVLYPGEGHGNRRAASRLDYNVRLLQWMEHYLQGPGGAPPPYDVDYGFGTPAKTSATSTGGHPPRLPRFLEEDTRWDDTAAHVFCGRRGCPCCIGR